MANYHLFLGQVENCLLGLFHDQQQQQQWSRDEVHKIRETGAKQKIIPHLFTYDYDDVLINHMISACVEKNVDPLLSPMQIWKCHEKCAEQIALIDFSAPPSSRQFSCSVQRALNDDCFWVCENKYWIMISSSTSKSTWLDHFPILTVVYDLLQFAIKIEDGPLL